MEGKKREEGNEWAGMRCGIHYNHIINVVCVVV